RPSIQFTGGSSLLKEPALLIRRKVGPRVDVSRVTRCECETLPLSGSERLGVGTVLWHRTAVPGSVPFYETSHRSSLPRLYGGVWWKCDVGSQWLDTKGAKEWPWEFVDSPISTELMPPVPVPLSLSGIMVVVLVNWSVPRTDPG